MIVQNAVTWIGSEPADGGDGLLLVGSLKTSNGLGDRRMAATHGRLGGIDGTPVYQAPPAKSMATGLNETAAAAFEFALNTRDLSPGIGGLLPARIACALTRSDPEGMRVWTTRWSAISWPSAAIARAWVWCACRIAMD